MRNSILFDPNSRYNNIDNKNIIFLTPNQVRELDIGFDLSHFKQDEFDDLFPFLVDSLKEMVKETTVGATNGSDIRFSVGDSECGVYLCISINGKLCKLQSEEWDITNNFKGLPPHIQIKLFQRLISEGQITLDDLATADIDNTVYKKLVANDLDGVSACTRKIQQLDKILEEQSKNKAMIRRKERVIESL